MAFKTNSRSGWIGIGLRALAYEALGAVELVISDFADGKRAGRKRGITRVSQRTTRSYSRAPRAYYRPITYRQPRPIVIVVDWSEPLDRTTRQKQLSRTDAVD